MKVNASKEIQNNESLAGWIILHGLTEALPNRDDFDQVAEKGRGVDDQIRLDIKLNIGGIDIDFLALCKDWQNQVESMIQKEAEILIANKFSDITDIMYDLEERLKPEIKKRLEGWESDSTL